MKINFKQLFKSKKIIALVIALVLCICLCVIIFVVKPFNSSTSVEQRTATVRTRDITVSVTGSGSVAAAQAEDITADVNTTVTKIYHKDGDVVKAGDVLYELDNTDAKNNLLKSTLNLKQQQLSQNTLLKNLNNLTVKAPFSGYVSDIAITPGDTLNKDGSILTLTDKSKLTVNLPFSYADAKKLKKSQKVYLSSPNLANTITGTISSLVNNSYMSANGEELADVKITINNPGALTNDIKVTGYVSTPSGQISSVDYGSVKFANIQAIKNTSGGTVKSLNVEANQYVKKGTVLAVIQNDDLIQNKILNEMNLDNLKLQLNEAKKTLNKYTIKAPFDGVITDSSAKSGDEIKSSDVLCKISDNKHLIVEVNIDELDISKIKVGQDATISLDALTDTANNPIPCKITKIDSIGSSSDGVTTYPVTISILKTDNIKIGMNADASIIINSKKNVLTIPVEAVQKLGNRSFVFVKGGSSSQENSTSSGNQSGGNSWGNSGNNSSSGNNNWNNSGNSSSSGSNNNGFTRRRSRLTNDSYYKGATLTPIETGINDESNIEIVSGLSEGTEVVLPQLAYSTSSSKTTSQSGFGGFGGMGGMGSFNGNGNNRRSRNNSSSSGNSNNSSSKNSNSVSNGGN